MSNGGHIHAENIWDAYTLLHEGTLALAEVEQQGMRVDVDYILKKNIWIDKKIAKLESIIYESEFFENWKKFHKGKVRSSARYCFWGPAVSCVFFPTGKFRRARA